MLFFWPDPREAETRHKGRFRISRRQEECEGASEQQWLNINVSDVNSNGT